MFQSPREMLWASVSPQPLSFACSKYSWTWNNSVCTPLSSTFFRSAVFLYLIYVAHTRSLFLFIAEWIPLCGCAIFLYSFPIVTVWSYYEYNCYRHSCASPFYKHIFSFYVVNQWIRDLRSWYLTTKKGTLPLEKILESTA